MAILRILTLKFRTDHQASQIRIYKVKSDPANVENCVCHDSLLFDPAILLDTLAEIGHLSIRHVIFRSF